MGRPLRKDTIEAMGLVASGKTLSKQVGYNKYRTVEDVKEIVRLAEVADGEDVVLTLHDGNDDYAVLKITKHLFHTTGGIYAYKLNSQGKVEFLKEGVDVYEDPTPTIKISVKANGEVLSDADIEYTYNGETKTAQGEVSLTLASKEDKVTYEITLPEGYESEDSLSGETSADVVVSCSLIQCSVTVSIADSLEVDAIKNNGEAVESPFTVDYGTSVNVTVEKEGYTFTYSEEMPYTVTADTTITATGTENVEEPTEEQPAE